MPGVRKRRTASKGPDYRRYLLHRLRRIREEATGRSNIPEEFANQAYGLGRIEALETGQNVRVTGYEISDLEPRVESLGAYTITSDNRIRL